MVAVSWVAAMVACLGYGVGSVLQSVGARRTAHVSGVTGVALILVQLPYMLGLAADALAFVANLVALRELPLFLVQSILTASVGVTAVIAAVRGSRLTWKDWVSLGVLGVGLVLLSIAAQPDNAIRVSEMSGWVILASSLLPVLVGAVALRLADRPSALVLALGSGLAFTGVAVAARGVSADPIGVGMLTDPLLWTIVLQGLIGMVFYALALQRGAVTSVTAITFVVEMVVPSVIGLLLFGDTVDSGLELYAGLGFALAIGGTIALMRFAE